MTSGNKVAPVLNKGPPGPGPSKLNAAAVNSKIIHETFECCRGGVCPVHGGLRASPSRSLMDRGPVTTWSSINNMPKDIAEYAIDRAVTTDLKKDDIQRHSVDEKLDPFQRALVCIKSTESLEKIYVASKMDVFIKENCDRTFREIVPMFLEELKKLGVDFHNAAANSILAACKDLWGRKMLNQAKQLLQLIFQYIDVEDSSISQAWNASMLELMDFLSPNELENEFGPVVLSKAKNANSVNGRKAACLLIKKMLSKVSTEFGTKQLVPLVALLCQDSKSAVKGTMCLQLPFICPFLKPKESILQYLNLLAKDVDAIVKTSLISTIRKLFAMADMKPTFLEILPLFKKIVKEAFVANNLPLLQEFSLDMGEIARTLSEASILNPDNKLWFLDAYVQMCRYGLPSTERPNGADLPTGFLNFRNNLGYMRRHSLAESLISSGGASKPATKAINDTILQQGWSCRVNAANGFNSFVKFAKDIIDFKAGLHPLIVDLIHDPIAKVRAAMAGNMFPIMELLKPMGHVLCNEFVYALSDDDLGVIEAIVPQVGAVLKVLVLGNVISPDNMTQALVEVGGALIFCEERLQGTINWRMHAKLLEQLSVLPFCFPGDYIYANIVPNLFHRLLHLRQMPCRLAAADTIVAFLRHCRRSHQREEIRRKIKETFANGRSFQDRMLYLFMSKMIMDNFSRKYFREYFFEQTLNMADDPVANVRMKLCGIMPTMQGTLKNADDNHLLMELEKVVAKIRNSENDRDVQNALMDAVEDMKKMEATSKSRDKKNKGRTREDADDEAKEKEEAFIESLEPASSTADKQSNKNKEAYNPYIKSGARKLSLVGPPPPPQSIPKPVPNKTAPAPPPLQNPTPPPVKPVVAVPAKPQAGPVAAQPVEVKLKTGTLQKQARQFGSGTRIVEKTADPAPPPPDAKDTAFLAEAQRLRRKTLPTSTIGSQGQQQQQQQRK